MKTAKTTPANAKALNGKSNEKEMPGTDGAKLQVVKGQEQEPKKEALPEPEKPADEKTKVELKQEVKTLNLESTLKLVEDLHRRSIQRKNLLATIETLEDFEVAQTEDAEETGNARYYGCVLKLEDDENRTFITKNTFIISAVAKFVNDLCVSRLGEIEADITLPPAA